MGLASCWRPNLHGEPLHGAAPSARARRTYKKGKKAKPNRRELNGTPVMSPPGDAEVRGSPVRELNCA